MAENQGYASLMKQEARSNPPKVTLDQLVAEEKQEVDTRAAQLRRESQRRLKNIELLAQKKEKEENERVRRILESRRKDIEEKRALITAGPRVKPAELLFDHCDEFVPEDVGEGIIKVNTKPGEKPAWNPGVGPSSFGPRVGFQPPSLVPPPSLPSRRQTKPSAGVLRPVSETPAASNVTNVASVRTDAGTKPCSAGGNSKPASALLNIDEALARADRGIERAREFSIRTASEQGSRPDTGAMDRYAAQDVRNQEHYRYHKPEEESGAVLSRNRLQAPSIVYYNNREACSAPCSAPETASARTRARNYRQSALPTSCMLRSSVAEE